MSETAGVETTPDDAARAEAKRLYPPLPAGAEDLTYPRAALREFARDAYLKGRADERAQIAARRGKLAAAVAEIQSCGHCNGECGSCQEEVGRILAALGVSEG